MNKKIIVMNVALVIVFGVLGLTMFNENVRTVEIIRLFACGAGFGAALTVTIFTFKSKQTKA
jgi:hypothetical protein